MDTASKWFLAGVWVCVMFYLAIDVCFAPIPAIVFAAMIALVIIAGAGVSYRRYWQRRDRRALDRENMRRHVIGASIRQERSR